MPEIDSGPYELHGTFIEACDCYVVCPCWVDDEPDEGHCTGLIAWSLAAGSVVAGVPVGGRTVVSVSTHSGPRRVDGAGNPTTSTYLYVDAGADEQARHALVRAFSGRSGGPLETLAEVSGTVVGDDRAQVTVEEYRDRCWEVRVTKGDTPFVHASGEPRRFDGRPDPLELSHTALSYELGVPEDAPRVEAQGGRAMGIHVGALPGGYLDVVGRSGMRGSFRYSHAGEPDPEPPRPANAVEPEDEAAPDADDE
ncbi:DUF1326 domain-containing protein [Actinomycetospora termitidis]|uniref:DUF1326 domain-containing protein n=1 Tax=Actinomycetospora termitidis TaxID=3053470 RepID=A0ABT7MGV7_9PSEU|nr:DUF1326 domain-containing protein [Actinomycetospora sp. Odt1-22]MDL5159923.1 DUF1326 domain-containing protein [Actinomycetospora sp. Odt1-22]